MAVLQMNVLIGKDRFGDPEIQIWDAVKMGWRAPATSEERVDALMALVLKIGVSLKAIGA